jgi:hypothetical protein
MSSFGVKTGGGLLRRVVGILAVLAGLWLVVKFPADAASVVEHVVQVLTAIINGVGTFLHRLLG